MKIVSLWNPKGGQGKSTISLNLAAAAVEIGLKSMIIDRDEQGTSLLFSNSGNLPFQVLADYPSEAPDVDLVILDHMASDKEIPRSPVIVMPFLPQRSQYAHYLDHYKRAQAAGKKIISVVTKGDTRKKVETGIIEEAKKRGVFEIKDNANFGAADEQYRTIFDERFNYGSNIKRARGEVSAVLTSILQNFENN